MKALIFLAMAALFAVPVAAADSINPKAEALLWYDAFDGEQAHPSG
jgi:opacity protein-like surface antigen